MASVYGDAIDPVLLAGHALGCAEPEAHGRESRHSFAQRTVVYHVGNGEGWGMQRVDGDIDYVSRLHLVARCRRLAQDAVGRESLDIAGIVDHHHQIEVGHDTVGVSKALILQVGHGYGFAMMGIGVEGELHPYHQCQHHQCHSAEVVPQITAFQFANNIG